MKKVFLFLTMLLLAFTGTMKAQSLTVCDGTATNGYVPVYGFYADAYNKCEMVYPADILSDMAGGTINGMTFYASESSVSWGDASFQVFLAEVADATITSFAGPGTVVYEGSLAISENQMVVTFDTPYSYGGGNLLVGFYQPTLGAYVSSTWEGATSNGSSISGYSYSDMSAISPTGRNFLPKVTFEYAAGGGGGGELVEVTIGDPTSTTVSSNIPGYSLYEYSISQQIYTADEIGVAGTINTLTMWLKNSSSDARNINVYMKEVEATEFASATAWESFAADDMVASFTMPNQNADPIEVALSLNTPFEYSGTNSLAICFQDVTGSWSSGLGGIVMDAAGNQAIYAYRDGTVYDPSNPGENGTLLAKKNVIRLSIMTGGGASTAFSTTPEVLDLGYRPNGAWMAPYVFNMKSNVGAVTVNYLDFSGNYFTYNAELPASVTAGNPLEVTVNHGEAEAGEVNSTITVSYSGNDRDVEQLEITATAYDPVDGDVWENAIEVPAMEERTDYNTNMPAGIYHNYELSLGSEAADAVYKMTFDHDVLLYAGAEEGNVVLYNHDFNGKPGPMADNQYVYNGPQINPGPTNIWFSYSYTGSNTWYGTSAGGGFYFGYKISADFIAANGLAGLTITTVEAAAREAYPYDCFIIEGGADPFEGNLISMGAIENPEALYFFDINLEVPAYISGNEDIWVIFYSDSPYAAYCGRYPADVNNGKIWTYNPNASAPAWTSNVNYTPVIYCRMLELPTGREVTMDLAKMEVKKGNGVESEIAEVEGNVMNVAKANMRNRDMQTLIEEGFEGGSMPTGWTQTGDVNSVWYVGSGDYSASTGSATGTYNALITHGTTGSVQYLVTPEMDLSNATSATVSCNYVNRSWAGDYDGFAICYRVNGGAWNELFVEPSYHSVWNNSGNIELTGLAANYQIGFRFTDNYGYGVGVDDVVVTADITSGGGGDDPWAPSFEAQIDGMFVPAGTYYLVAAADENAEVNIAIDEVPAPEQAVIISPEDSEQNVESPYLAQWILPEYTTEMQVLLGTQYPPQTAMIDWTDYLVESAFLMDLLPNQSYYMQVNVRNATGTTEGEIIAFSTPIDPVEGFEVAEANLYPGDAAVFTWNAPRSFQGYNIYQDGVKLNETPFTETTYTVEGLEYNMQGYSFQVTAVYDAGESAMSEAVTVYMTGFGTISGHVYDAPEYDPEEPDQSHPVAGIPVTAIVLDEYGQTQNYEFVTDDEGFYTGDVLATTMCVIGISEENSAAYGYAVATIDGIFVPVAYEEVVEGLDIYTHEYYYPLGMITATEQEADVLVEWSWNPSEVIVDFESGDFSQADFTLPAQYPWAITTTNPHDGTYCMKSTCEGVASGTSSIEATVDVPYDAKMGFWVRTSSESNFDKFHFYIDGVEQGQALSGNNPYAYKEYTVAQGTHTYKWEYAKDSSVNSNDDCIYVDDVTLYRKDEPVPPTPGGQTFDFEDGTMQGWTTIDADGDGYNWNLASSTMGTGYGHNGSSDMIFSQSYDNNYGVLYPDNYLVSPTTIAAQDGAAISFFACAQDSGYPGEHFGVAVSTTTATAAAFEMVQEWTMTAKDGGKAEGYSAIRGTREQGNWYQYTVDLSSYAGQTIWVAIRHFNCSDMFYLDVDDITLADGSAKGFNRGGDRTFQSFNLYRRNLLNGEEPGDPIATLGADVMDYTDTEWATLNYGEYQWGIQAVYDGYAPVPDRNRETATFGFENGSLEGWTGIVVNTDGGEWIHSNNNLGGYDYTELAHTGTGFAMCYSYVDYDGAYDTDAYLVSPQKYAVDANSSIAFWADNANDDYPEDFSVCVSTAANPTASDFTQIWSGGAKGTGVAKTEVRHNNTRYENWRSHEISLAAYAGQEIWIAFHDVNYDAYEIWIDDVTITYAGSAPVPPTPVPGGNGLSEILWSEPIDKDMVATITFNVALNNGQDPAGAAIAIVGENNTYDATVTDGPVVVEVRKGDVYDITVSMDGYYSFNDEWEATENEKVYDITLEEIIESVDGFYVSPTGWAMWEGGSVGPVPPTPGDDESFTEGFEGGLNGWTNIIVNADGGEWIHSDDNLGGYDYTELAHGGSGFAMCYSFVDNVGAYNTDAYLVTPQKYNIVDGSTLTFWADNANDDYPESFSVCVATADAPTAADFTEVWSGEAKGTVADKANVRHNNNRYENWRSHNVDLSAYAGQEVYIAFHDVNYDAYEVWIDDVELAVINKGDRAPLSYKFMLDGAYAGETSFPGFQFDVTGMEEGSVHVGAVAPLYVNGMGEWVYYTWTYTACDNFAGISAGNAVAEGENVKLTWNMPGVNPGGGGGGQSSESWTEDFEAGALPTGWATIDADGDGYNWNLASSTMGTGYGHNGSSDMIFSQSYDNSYGVLYPDNYLVTPQVTPAAGSTFSFFACAQDSGYPGEHYGVAVSTGSQTNASDFTMIEEWTMTAKGSGVMAPGRDGQTRAQGAWYEKTVDLSAYAGQNIYIAIRHFNCSDMFYLDVDDVTFSTPAKAERAMWDLVYSFNGTSAGQQAVATDGEYIYTASWQATPTGGHTFYQYDLQGNFIEGFEISGATGIRDITYDGQYFYGTSGGAQIFCMDFTTRTLVSTINCSGLTSRHISYDPVRDGFWSGNWTTLALYSRTGALLQSGPAPTSAYGSAYYKDSDDVEHLYLFCQPNSDCKVYDYNITTGTLGTNVVLDFTSTAPGCTGIAGGCFIGAYAGKTCWFGNSQQEPNLIGIYELDGDAPVPPTPGQDGILGAMVFVEIDGELAPIAFVEGETASQYVVEGMADVDATYAVRVVYGGALDTTYYAMSCPVEIEYTAGPVVCDPVTNLTAVYAVDAQLGDGALIEWTGNAAANSYNVYVDGQLLGNTQEEGVFIYGLTAGATYTFGITAVYANCESEMVSVTYTHVDAVEEDNEIVEAIYPNPTSGDLHISANAMTQVSIYNAMGQMVYNQTVSGNEMVIDMAQFEAGVYMVRIDTESGSSVKRVTVVK